MTEKEFLSLFNDIDDKFINEEQESNAPLYPVRIQYSSEKKSAVRSFSWGSFAAAAAVCVLAAGGVFAAGYFCGSGDFSVGNTTTIPYQTVAEYTSAPASEEGAVSTDTTTAPITNTTTEKPDDPVDPDNGSDLSALELIGLFINENETEIQSRYCIDTSKWEELDDFDLFREIFSAIGATEQ